MEGKSFFFSFVPSLRFERLKFRDLFTNISLNNSLKFGQKLFLFIYFSFLNKYLYKLPTLKPFQPSHIKIPLHMILFYAQVKFQHQNFIRKIEIQSDSTFAQTTVGVEHRKSEIFEEALIWNFLQICR